MDQWELGAGFKARPDTSIHIQAKWPQGSPKTDSYSQWRKIPKPNEIERRCCFNAKEKKRISISPSDGKKKISPQGRGQNGLDTSVLLKSCDLPTFQFLKKPQVENIFRYYFLFLSSVTKVSDNVYHERRSLRLGQPLVLLQSFYPSSWPRHSHCVWNEDIISHSIPKLLPQSGWKTIRGHTS